MYQLVKIVKNLSYNNNYYPEKNTRKFITIHETANTSVGANSDAHANFINNGAMETWHYTVDSEKAIQHYYHTTSCWAAGTYNGNTQSINIEMCVNSDGDYEKTIANTVSLVKQIMKQENIPVSHVVQHNYWSGKDCPTQLRDGRNGINWNGFIAKIKGTSTKPKKVGIWHVNEYGTYYRSKKGTFIVGSEKIETRIGSPFRTAKSGGHVKPKQTFDFHTVCIQDGHYWLELTNNKKEEEFVPICTVKGLPPKQTYSKIWGKYKK